MVVRGASSQPCIVRIPVDKHATARRGIHIPAARRGYSNAFGLFKEMVRPDWREVLQILSRIVNNINSVGGRVGSGWVGSDRVGPGRIGFGHDPPHLAKRIIFYSGSGRVC